MILSVTSQPRYAPPVEFVERKGTGHPDTLCDALAEGLSRMLARGYVEHTGAIQHFNVDKALLAAGSVDVRFGEGKHLERARLILVGKADVSRWQPDVDELRDLVRKELGALLPDADLDAGFEIDVWLTQSSADLSLVVSGRDDLVPLANDTSFAVASVPRSPLEQTVHDIETTLNSDEFRASIPIGRDIKVMGARAESTSITVAVPVLARKVSGPADYAEALAAVEQRAQEVAAANLAQEVDIAVNGADHEDSPYLTISGTSAEAGDDGQVGRGNRFGGLITPYRPMSLEAAAGKNPAAHVGKAYHATAHDIATRIVDETGAEGVPVKLLSRIGNPVTDPHVVHVGAVGDIDTGAADRIVRESLDDWSGVLARLIDGRYELF